jgi:mevalonate pyrophosphate decarboxylase
MKSTSGTRLALQAFKQCKSPHSNRSMNGKRSHWYRRRAEKIRTEARDVTDVSVREDMERLANKYDRMAANLERGWPLKSDLWIPQTLRGQSD